MTQASHAIMPTIRNRFHPFMLSVLLLTGILVTPNGANANEQQWGHWRGPTGNGESLTATPPKEFAPEGWHIPSDAEWTIFEDYLVIFYLCIR